MVDRSPDLGLATVPSRPTVELFRSCFYSPAAVILYMSEGRMVISRVQGAQLCIGGQVITLGEGGTALQWGAGNKLILGGTALHWMERELLAFNFSN